ncbi:MAG TPA: hypothetical protein PKN13_00970 [Accumulibacter sp.]|nr:hypothetical protein [Accumulibacter sp.]HNE11777.1 hypothetical protein [Accumulibacter sp.]HNG38044.1 hypothetical protein [Accumulibacter sp.]HNH23832.1 hypothetical protein [Accumulibacter sp.]HNI73019.1 hypothetical protein [Accumulibacter sp.]
MPYSVEKLMVMMMKKFNIWPRLRAMVPQVRIETTFFKSPRLNGRSAVVNKSTPQHICGVAHSLVPGILAGW